jgi:hypothetical protein
MQGMAARSTGRRWMLSQLEYFSMNMMLLLGLLMAGAIILILIIVSWTGIKLWIFRIRQQRGRTEEYARKHFADGRARPPRDEGICDRCQGAFGDVYYLPSGEKLCAKCYGAKDAPPEP